MATAARTGRTPAQTFALVFGVVYLAVGIIGFAVTGFDGWFSESFNEELLIFPLNPAHNIVHLLIGAVGLWASRTAATARAVNVAIGIAYLAVFLLGLLGALKWLAIDSGINPDQLLHVVTGLLSVYFGTAGSGTRARPATA
jgi:F0F1-type ATP synthase membrane subunit a